MISSAILPTHRLCTPDRPSSRFRDAAEFPPGAFRVSLAVAGITVVGASPFAFPAAVAISRFRYRGRKAFLVAILIGQTIPAMALISQCQVLDSRHLVNQVLGLSIAYLGAVEQMPGVGAAASPAGQCAGRRVGRRAAAAGRVLPVHLRPQAGVAATLTPAAHTARTVQSSSRTTTSAAYPGASRPSRSPRPSARAGTAVTAATAATGSTPCASAFRSALSRVSMEPASVVVPARTATRSRTVTSWPPSR